jgi:hypothetical protein
MNILNFFDFIFEKYQKIEVPLQFSKEFEQILRSINSPISEAILQLRFTPQEFSLLNIGEDNDSATYTTSTKLSQHFKTEDSKQLNTMIQPLSRLTEIYFKNRTSIKIGRLVKKLLADTFSNIEVEKFVNEYKDALDSSKTTFEVWSKSKILDGYASQNYSFEGPPSNSLMNSCMNDELAYVDFYKYVPVNLLVLLNSEGHILGRSLIWQTDQGLFMDRVYTILDYHYYKFLDYAKTHNLIYKAENKSGSGISYVKDSRISWFKMEVKLNFDISEYNRDEFYECPRDIPYMDTFVYGQKNHLINYEPKGGTYYLLTSTDGESVEITVQFDIYGERIQQDKLDQYEWSLTQRGWIPEESAVYISVWQDYLSIDYLQNPENGFELVDNVWRLKK